MPRSQQIPNSHRNNYSGLPSSGLPPSHPLLREAQEALKQHLKRRLATLDQQLFETKAKAREVEIEHSELGQQLFEGQQRLAAYQSQVERLTEEEKAARKVHVTTCHTPPLL